MSKDIELCGYLVCGVLDGFEPFGFRDKLTGDLVGYEVDYCKGLADFLGVEARFTAVAPEERIGALVEERVDVLAALLSSTPERAEQATFCGVYNKDASQMLVLESSGIGGVDELRERPIAIVRGTILEQTARSRFPKARIVLCDDVPSSYSALQAGQADALFLRTTTLVALRKADGQGKPSKILPETLLAPETGFVVRKGNDRLRAAINAFLAKCETDGTAQRIFDRWCGADSIYGLVRTFRVAPG